MTGRLYLRGKIWWMRYTHRGREVRISCGTGSREAAQGKMDWTLAKLRVTGVVESRDVRLEDLVADYIKDCQSTNREGVAVSAERNWRLHLEPFFHRMKIANLGTADFADYRRHRLEEGAAQASINRELQICIASYKLGYRSTPPKVERMPYIKLVKEDNARKTFISEAEREKIFESASQEGLAWRVLVEMAYLFGWRRSELLGLQVRNIDIVDKVIRIDDSKNGEAREIPMTERLSLLIQQLISGRPAEDRVFPKSFVGGNFDRIWKRIRVNAGCPNALMHDWRRTSARVKRAAGVPEGVIMELQGWKTAAMFRRYAIVNNDDKRRALELVDLPGGKA